MWLAQLYFAKQDAKMSFLGNLLQFWYMKLNIRVGTDLQSVQARSVPRRYLCFLTERLLQSNQINATYTPSSTVHRTYSVSSVGCWLWHWSMAPVYMRSWQTTISNGIVLICEVYTGLTQLEGRLRCCLSTEDQAPHIRVLECDVADGMNIDVEWRDKEAKYTGWCCRLATDRTYRARVARVAGDVQGVCQVHWQVRSGVDCCRSCYYYYYYHWLRCALLHAPAKENGFPNR